jgi:death on curing protein
MIRHLSREDLLELAAAVQEQDGGQRTVRDVCALDAAVAQPLQVFALSDVYPTPLCKAAALGFSIVHLQPFTDGNKRIAHAAIEAMLMINGFELKASDEESRALMDGIEDGSIDTDKVTAFVSAHAVEVRR